MSNEQAIGDGGKEKLQDDMKKPWVEPDSHPGDWIVWL